MINRKIKGQRTKRQAMKYWTDKQWKVSGFDKCKKYQKECDGFGLFDLVIIKGNIVGFVQVTCNRPHDHRKYELFAKEHEHTLLWFVQMVKYDRKGFRIWTYHKPGYRVEVE